MTIYVTLREVLCDLREQALFFHTLKYGKEGLEFGLVITC